MKNNLEQKILASFYKRAPNILTIENILYDLENIEAQEVKNSIVKLCNAGKLIVTHGDTQIKPHYSLPSYENVLVSEYMDIAGFKAPRLLRFDRPRPEDINIFFEMLCKRTIELEAEFEKRLDQKLRNYWSNIIVLFGIFVALFSIIVTFVGKVEIKQDSTFIKIFLINAAQVMPIAIVLAGFVVLLNYLFNRK